jgi:hypothetical protein
VLGLILLGGVDTFALASMRLVDTSGFGGVSGFDKWLICKAAD